MKKSAVMIACLLSAGTISFAQGKKQPPPPPPKPPVIVKMNEEVKYHPTVTVKDFYERNESVAKVTRETPDKIIVTNKDKSVERYNISREDEKKAFLDKYGEIPMLPPPPPPPPPVKERS